MSKIIVIERRYTFHKSMDREQVYILYDTNYNLSSHSIFGSEWRLMECDRD